MSKQLKSEEEIILAHEALSEDDPDVYAVYTTDTSDTYTRDDGDGNGYDLIVTEEGSLFIILDHESSASASSLDKNIFEGVPEEIIEEALPHSEFAILPGLGGDEQEIYASSVWWKQPGEDAPWIQAYGPSDGEGDDSLWLVP